MPSPPTYVDTTNAAAVTQWGKKLSVQTTDYMHRILQPDSPWTSEVAEAGGPCNTAVVYDMQLTNSPGATVKRHLMVHPALPAVVGDAEFQGQEGGLEWATFSYGLDNWRTGIRNNNPRNDQLVSFDLMGSHVSMLAQSVARKLLIGALLHLSGYKGVAASTYVDDANQQIDQSDLAWAFNNAVEASSAQSIFRPDSETTDEGVEASASGYPTLDNLDLVIEAMQTLKHRPRPPMTLQGNDFYPMIVPPQFMTRLRQDSRWQSIHQELLSNPSQTADTKMHPYFSGSVGSYRCLIFFETNLACPGYNSSTFAALTKTWRCPILGCESLYILPARGYSPGDLFKLATETEDVKFRRLWHAVSMLGMDRPRFTDPQDELTYDLGVFNTVWRLKT